jgi:hypothetical protein
MYKIILNGTVLCVSMQVCGNRFLDKNSSDFQYMSYDNHGLYWAPLFAIEIEEIWSSHCYKKADPFDRTVLVIDIKKNKNKVLVRVKNHKFIFIGMERMYALELPENEEIKKVLVFPAYNDCYIHTEKTKITSTPPQNIMSYVYALSDQNVKKGKRGGKNQHVFPVTFLDVFS